MVCCVSVLALWGCVCAGPRRSGTPPHTLRGTAPQLVSCAAAGARPRAATQGASYYSIRSIRGAAVVNVYARPAWHYWLDICVCGNLPPALQVSLPLHTLLHTSYGWPRPRPPPMPKYSSHCCSYTPGTGRGTADGHRQRPTTPVSAYRHQRLVFPAIAQPRASA